MPAPLSPQLFAILSGLVEERLGIHYGPDEHDLFGDKVLARAAEAGFESALDYYYFLRYDPAAAAELDALADALVVGETYFFRELDALRAGIDVALAPAIARAGRARVWSAGCATGEEPLSIAMLLEEAGLRERCEIVATDVSARSLAKAKAGTYGARSLRALPEGAVPEGFSARLAAVIESSLAREGNRAQASPRLLDGIDFRRVNLLDPAAVAQLGAFDLILCRNVLIYFADATVKRVVESLAANLAPHGRLVVGASESLLRFGTALRCEERGGAFLYTKDPS